ncbi:MAG: hypothetical protein FJ395_07135 [Verrucomicrobia bacterium]|nr:hypothetical protein [Verrucomicrobiota bacterium]
MRQNARARAGRLLGVGVLFFGLIGTAGAEPWKLEELKLVLDKVRAENADLKSQLDLREVVIRNLQESLAVARTESEMFQRKWAEAQMRAQTLGANPNDSEATAAQRQLADTVRHLAQAQAERRRLAEQLQRLLGAVQSNANVSVEVEATEKMLATLQRPSEEVTAAAAGRLEAARILDVNPKLRAVVLDVGAEQGVRVGMPFLVLRGDRVVAGLRVIEVRPRVSGALIENTEKGVVLQAGDAVRVTKSVSVTPK